MSIRKKSRRRLLILLGIALVVGGGIATALGVRESRRESAAYDARAAAFKHLEKREFGPCLEAFHRYFRQFPGVLDVEARLACAKVIAEMPDSHPHQLSWGRQHARRIVDNDPNHLTAQIALLQINSQQGSLSESLATSGKILELAPGNVDVAVQHALLLKRLRSTEQALAFLKEQLRETAESWQLRSLQLELLHESKPEQLDEHVKATRAGVLDQDLHALLDLISLRFVGQGTEARDSAIELASRIQGSPDRLRAVANQLSLLGAHEHAIKLLGHIPAGERDHDEYRYLIQESTRNGQSELALEFGRDWDFEPLYLETDVLGQLALASGRINDGPANFRTALEERRSRSSRAKAWLLALSADPLRRDPAPLHDRLEASFGAIEQDDKRAEAWHFAGLAFREAGEIELAQRHFYKAAELASTWADPVGSAAQMMASQGNLLQAQDAARILERRSGKMPPGLALLLAISDQDQAPEGGDSNDPVHRLVVIAKRAGLGSSEIAPLALAMVSRKGSAEHARKLIESILRAEHSTDTLIGASAISRKLDLGLSQRCIDRARSLHGESPALARETALVAARGTSPKAALLAFDKARSTSNAPHAPAWDVAHAQLLGALEDEAGTDAAWRSVLANEKANTTQIARALSRVTPLGEDPGFVAAVNRLHSQTHDRCTAWRIHACRQKLASKALAADDIEQIEEHLDYVVGIRPKAQVVRDLRLSLFIATKQTSKALDELRTLLRADPANVDHALQAADLLLVSGQPVEARSVLRSLLVTLNQRKADTTYAQQTRIAAQLVRAGAIDDARTYVRRAAAVPGASSEQAGAEDLRLARAEALIGLGALDQADKLLADLGSAPVTAQAIVLRAGIARLEGRPADENRLLKALDVPNIDEVTRLRLRIQHYTRTRALELATQEYERLGHNTVLTDDELRTYWASLLRLGRSTALRSVEAPASAVEARRWARHRDLLASLSETLTLRELGGHCVEGFSATEALVQDLASIQAHVQNPATLDSSELTAMAARHPDNQSLQLTVAREVAALGELETAAEHMERLRSRFPASPAAAEAQARLHDRLGDSRRARSAALRWHALTFERSIEARTFLAERSTASEAQELLDPVVLPALRAGSARPMLVFGRAMIQLDRTKQLTQALGALLREQPLALRVWLTLARHTIKPGKTGSAREMLGHETLRTPVQLPTTTLIENASAWLAVAQGDPTNGADARQAGTRLMELAEERPDLTARNWASLGLLWKAAGDLPRATSAYERALDNDPTELLAGNNFAMILLRDGKAGEALALTGRVIEVHGSNADLLDTHGQVADANQQLSVAADAYARAIRLDRGAAQTAIRLLDVLLRAGELEQARSTIEYLDRKMDKSSLGEEDQKRLEELRHRIDAR